MEYNINYNLIIKLKDNGEIGFFINNKEVILGTLIKVNNTKKMHDISDYEIIDDVVVYANEFFGVYKNVINKEIYNSFGINEIFDIEIERFKYDFAVSLFETEPNIGIVPYSLLFKTDLDNEINNIIREKNLKISEQIFNETKTELLFDKINKVLNYENQRKRNIK